MQTFQLTEQLNAVSVAWRSSRYALCSMLFAPELMFGVLSDVLLDAFDGSQSHSAGFDAVDNPPIVH